MSNAVLLGGHAALGAVAAAMALGGLLGARKAGSALGVAAFWLLGGR
jgi:hypothetical protein